MCVCGCVCVCLCTQQGLVSSVTSTTGLCSLVKAITYYIHVSCAPSVFDELAQALLTSIWSQFTLPWLCIACDSNMVPKEFLKGHWIARCIILHGEKFSRVAIFADVGFRSFSNFEDRPWDKATPPIFTNPRRLDATPSSFTRACKSCQNRVKQVWSASYTYAACLNYEYVLWRRWSVATMSIKAEKKIEVNFFRGFTPIR